jgi:predicted CopG family antitoxin
MGTRTISLAEDAYEALSAMRRPGESFTDVVRRLTRTRSLTELGEAMDSEAAEEVASAVEANREKRIQRRREELDLE